MSHLDDYMTVVVVVLTVHKEVVIRAGHIPDLITGHTLVESFVMSLQWVKCECSVFHVQRSSVVPMHELAVFHPVNMLGGPGHIAHEFIPMSFDGWLCWRHDLH